MIEYSHSIILLYFSIESEVNNMAKGNKFMHNWFERAEKSAENDFCDWFDEFGDFHDLGESAENYIMSINHEIVNGVGADNFSLKLW